MALDRYKERQDAQMSREDIQTDDMVIYQDAAEFKKKCAHRSGPMQPSGRNCALRDLSD